MNPHEWQTNDGLPGRSYDFCIHCGARAIRWLVDGQWRERQTAGPKGCGGRET